MERVKGTGAGQRANTLKSEPALNNSGLSSYRVTLAKQIRWGPGLYGEQATRFSLLLVDLGSEKPPAITFSNI